MSMPSTVADDWANTVAPANPANSNGGLKKPRHRHAPEQLAALNELFEKDEHPPLDVRSALAERLGMETKTVNAWFQNKRASSKKRTRTVPNDRPNGSHLNMGSGSSSSTNTPAAPTTINPPGDPLHLEEEHHSHSANLQHPIPQSSYADIIQATTFVTQPDYSGLSSGRNTPDNMPKKLRMRPSTEQTEELKKLYNTNPHPTAEERQALAERIGMRYQSITNWFQNQRSLAKRRKEDEPVESSSSSRTDYPHSDMRQYSAFPPPPPHHMHPSLTTPSNSAVSFPDPNVSGSRGRRSLSPSAEVSPRRSLRRSVTPYSSAMLTRPRRSRPEPYQLDALKVLFTRTSTPTIEERSALALEIGMDVGKVTNWFRNLRQTARKRSSRFSDLDLEGINSGLDEEDGQDNDQDDLGRYSLTNSESRSASRNGTPSLSTRSSSSSSVMGISRRMHDPPQSSMPSDDEDYSEAITPEPGNSPSPAPQPASKFDSRELPAPAPNREASYCLTHPSASHAYHYPPQQYPPPARHYYSHQHSETQSKPFVEKDSSTNIGFHHLNATIAIFDSSYHPASKSYFANEDPETCAATAKRFGINIEDAYLLLDFHRQ